MVCSSDSNCVRRKSEKIDEFIDYYSKNTSIHGVKYWGEKDRTWREKVFWVMITLVSIYFCIHNVYKLNATWKFRPVMFSFSKTLLQTYDTPFPSVTICAEDKIKKSEIDLKKVRASNFENIPIEKLHVLSQICHFDDNEKLMELLNKSQLDTSQFPQALEDISYSDYEYFSKCRLGIDKEVDCREIFQKIITDEGICYTFNMLDYEELQNGNIDESLKLPKVGKNSSWFLKKQYENGDIDAYPRRVIGYGIKNGLFVELKMNESDFNPGCKRHIQGFRIQVHLPVIYPEMSKIFYAVPFGKRTMMSLSPEMIYSSSDIINHNPEVRQCYFTGEQKLEFSKIYTRSGCEDENFARKVVDSCDCAAFYMMRDSGTDICDISKMKCIQEVMRNCTTMSLARQLFAEELLEKLKSGEIKRSDPRFMELEKMDTCDCLPSCTSLEYHSEIQQLDLIKFDDEISINTRHLDASFNVYFKDSSFVRLKRYEIYGFTEFLSNTGGIFGLFLGCSVLSFVEIFYHLVRFLYRKIRPDQSDELQYEYIE